jgi:integrase/recombinase XerD
MANNSKLFSQIKARPIFRTDHQYIDGTHAVILQVFIDSKRIKFNLGIRIPKKLWNSKSLRIRPSHPEADDLNLVIEHALAKVQSIAMDARLKMKRITPAEFDHLFFGVESDLFAVFWEHEMERMRPQMRHGTYKHHKSVLKKVVKYAPEATFTDLDVRYLMAFDRFLIKEYGNAHNTRVANFNKIRRYINLAIAQEKMDRNPFDHFKMSFQDGHRAVLSRDQVATLVKMWRDQLLNGGHHVALQNFLLGCFTGLRISDVYLVRKSMIDGNRLIFSPKKTQNRNKVIEIPLTGMAKKFIALGGDHLADRLSEQKTNLYLKEIAIHAEIHQNLTFHVARHTFATIYLELGGSVEVLQRILGHAKMATTMKYVHIARARMEHEMGLFDAQDWGDSSAS